MSAKILDGKKLAEDLHMEMREEISALIKENKIMPCLTVVIVGDNPASQVYVRNKHRTCAEIGIESHIVSMPEKTSEEELLQKIYELNNDIRVHGILVQLPLPKAINADTILEAISADKDVDGFHPMNAGKLFIGKSSFVPCTPAGIMELLTRNNIQISGKKAVIVGRSNIVGKPMAILLLKENATVTVCHSRTMDLEAVVRDADIVIAAVGKPRFITKNMIKEGAVVIDVGINRVDDKLIGDVDFEGVVEVAGYITKVPGGIGPLTIAMLLKNTIHATKLSCKNIK